MYSIRKISRNEVNEALALALEVFMQFEAPDYSPEGVTTFKRDIVENEEFINSCRQGICPIYAAFDGGKMVGIMGMRANGKGFYLRIGFIPLSEEQETDGIRFTPMKYVVR